MSWLLLAQTDVAARPDLLPPIGRTFAALAVVLALLLVLAWLLRKGVLRRQNSGALSVESALALGERRSLVIVTVEGRRLLLGLSPAHVALVTELRPGATFDQTLAQVSQRSQPA